MDTKKERNDDDVFFRNCDEAANLGFQTLISRQIN